MTIRYDDGKLQKAIDAGLIERSIDPDGVIRYRLTKAGITEWILEKMRSGNL